MLQVAALSDIGCRRTNNEDSFGYDVQAGIYAVSDGMGGSAAGEIASHIAVKTVMSHFRQMLGDDAARNQPRPDLLYFAMLHANAAVYREATIKPQYAGMGATLVALCIAGQDAVIASVGDSRAYLIRNDEASVITLDHSLGAEQVRNGLCLPSNDPSFNVITRAIGVAGEVQPDLFGAQLQPGDRVLLASDGLMKHLHDDEIARIVHNSDTVDQACSRLIEAVRAFGAYDNVTCLLVQA